MNMGGLIEDSNIIEVFVSMQDKWLFIKLEKMNVVTKNANLC